MGWRGATELPLADPAARAARGHARRPRAMQVPLDGSGPLRRAMARGRLPCRFRPSRRTAATAAADGGSTKAAAGLDRRPRADDDDGVSTASRTHDVTRGRKAVTWPPGCQLAGRRRPGPIARPRNRRGRRSASFSTRATPRTGPGRWHRALRGVDSSTLVARLRPRLVALPAPRAAFALRTLAPGRRAARRSADAAAYVVDDESTRAEALRRGALPPRLFRGPAVDALSVSSLADRYGADAWSRALEAVDGRGAHVLEAVQGAAVLDALFAGEEDAARARFDSKREEFCAAELRRVVCDACGVGRGCAAP